MDAIAAETPKAQTIMVAIERHFPGAAVCCQLLLRIIAEIDLRQRAIA